MMKNELLLSAGNWNEVQVKKLLNLGSAALQNGDSKNRKNYRRC